MAKGVNKVTLVGNLGKDPELKYTPKGDAVAKFTLATNYTYKKDGAKVQGVEWHNIVAWKRDAEILAEHAKKGTRLMIFGSLKTESWEEKETKKMMHKTSIIVSEFVLLGSIPAKDEPEQDEENMEEGEEQLIA
jgi:single-strand DNA-binding protein